MSTSQIRHPQKATSGHAAAVAAGLVLAVALTAAPDAMAGTGGTEFDAVNTRITDMIEGGGGKLAAGLGLVAALAASVVRFNIWAVIGVADETRGQVVKAFIVSNRGGGDAFREELQEFTASRLSRHEYPRRIDFVDALPKTPAGKVNRKTLRDAESARNEKDET